MKVYSARASHLAAALVTGFFVVAAPAWGQSINEDFKLLANDGDESDSLGASIAIDRSVVAMGAPFNDSFPFGGTAYLFYTFSGDQIRKVNSRDVERASSFGFSIALKHGLLAMGAPRDDHNGDDSGSAFLFDPSTGEQIGKLVAVDGTSGDFFGYFIAIDDGIVAVGAPFDDDNGSGSGSAYLFDASTGVQLAKLLPSDGASGDHFGMSIDIDNGIVTVGAPHDDDNGNGSGSAYLFDATTGDQIAKLLPDDGASGDVFGSSVAIDNGLVAVGAPFGDGNSRSSGSAYVFDASTGDQIAKLTADDGRYRDRFGTAIAIDNGLVAVGAPHYDVIGSYPGSAYLFDASTGTQIAKLLSSDGADGDIFGHSIALDDGVVAVGASGDDDNGNGSGSGYVFVVEGSGCVRDPEWVCDGDVDGDGRVNPVDAGLVQVHFGSGRDDALCNYDVDCDGHINPVDAGIVQSLFGTCEAPRGICR